MIFVTHGDSVLNPEASVGSSGRGMGLLNAQGLSLTVQTDGPDAWYRPASSAEWTSLGIPAPDLLFLMQDVTGSIVPTIDNMTSGQWAPQNSGNLYQQTVTGWTSYCVGLDGLVEGQGWVHPAASASLDLPTSSSWAMMAYIAIATPTTSQRWMVAQGNNNFMDITTAGAIRSRHDAVTGNTSVQAYDNIDLIHQIAWTRRSGTESGGRTNFEPLFCTQTDAGVSGARALGTNSVVPTPAQRCNMLAIWSGSNAEFNMGDVMARLRGVPGIPRYKAMGTAVSTQSTLTASWPTHAVDDVGFLVIETEGGASLLFSEQADFVHVSGSPVSVGDSATGTSLHVLWCRASGTSQANPSVDDNGNHVIARIVTFENCVTTGSPWDVIATGSDAVGSTDVTMPSVTTTVPYGLILNIATDSFDGAASQFSGGTNANLRGLRLFANNNTTSGNGGGFGVWIGEKKGAGATGTTTATAANSTLQALMTIALRGP